MKKRYEKPSVLVSKDQSGAGEIAQASGVIAVIVIAFALNILVPVP